MNLLFGTLLLMYFTLPAHLVRYLYNHNDYYLFHLLTAFPKWLTYFPLFYNSLRTVLDTKFYIILCNDMRLFSMCCSGLGLGKFIFKSSWGIKVTGWLRANHFLFGDLLHSKSCLNSMFSLKFNIFSSIDLHILPYL